MTKVFGAFIISLFCPFVLGQTIDIKTHDKAGCILADLKGNILGPTIAVMAESYKLHPEWNDEIILQVIQVAIDSKCDIDEIGPSELSPLNIAILHKKEELVRILLEGGANPRVEIDSERDFINGMDSYEFAELVNQQNNISKILAVLAEYKQLKTR